MARPPNHKATQSPDGGDNNCCKGQNFCRQILSWSVGDEDRFAQGQSYSFKLSIVNSNSWQLRMTWFYGEWRAFWGHNTYPTYHVTRTRSIAAFSLLTRSLAFWFHGKFGSFIWIDRWRRRTRGVLRHHCSITSTTNSWCLAIGLFVPSLDISSKQRKSWWQTACTWCNISTWKSIDHFYG